MYLLMLLLVVHLFCSNCHHETNYDGQQPSRSSWSSPHVMPAPSSGSGFLGRTQQYTELDQNTDSYWHQDQYQDHNNLAPPHQSMAYAQSIPGCTTMSFLPEMTNQCDYYSVPPLQPIPPPTHHYNWDTKYPQMPPTPPITPGATLSFQHVNTDAALQQKAIEELREMYNRGHQTGFVEETQTAASRRGTGEVICSICKKGFYHTGTVNRHIAGHHNQEREKKCPRCGKGFGTNSNLKRHIRHVHPGTMI